MPRNPRTPLSATAKEALEHLTDAIPDREEQGCPRDEAHQFLVDDEAFSHKQAERAIHQLLMRGYLYEVEGQLFVTT
ncbi:hypothetical protein [Halococcus thailandensis]|jgi:hypothetical protein|uniref:Uncharacterized protein n=1 Tax=Halococcus thailandensis JCM 13552 TaxID=1227457 RepID=M0NHP3_9EURY|nr:hypothetical protein [Halococcus thailandensis]EMA56629.1 hypothetical protein C451_01353 [Halococcus thailandensis JCM 13552]